MYSEVTHRGDTKTKVCLEPPKDNHRHVHREQATPQSRPRPCRRVRYVTFPDVGVAGKQTDSIKATHMPEQLTAWFSILAGQ